MARMATCMVYTWLSADARGSWVDVSKVGSDEKES